MSTKVTCLVLCLSAAVLVSGCGSKRSAAKVSSPSSGPATVTVAEPMPLPDATVQFIRNASFEKVYLNEHGQVVRFIPGKLVAAPGATLPPENAPLKHLRLNTKGEVIDWQLAETPSH